MGQSKALDDETNRNAAADLMAMLANSRRLAILSLLVRHEISVGDLAKLSGLSQSALSQHLAKLRTRKLVTARGDARTSYYTCKAENVIGILKTLEELFSDSNDSEPEVP